LRMGLPDWKRSIAELAYVKQRLAEVDTTGLWEHALPAVAATEAQLRAAENHIGQTLDPVYRAFLRHANGWPAVYQTVDLFGCDDLMGGRRFKHATEMLRFVDDGVLSDAGLCRDDLLRIAGTAVDLDLFVMTRRSTAPSGVVVWIAGSEVDRFPSFSEYFLAMIDYNRLELRELNPQDTA
jgi:hypothetical protein